VARAAELIVKNFLVSKHALRVIIITAAKKQKSGNAARFSQ
jgi:hypothetical protein